MIIAEIFPEIRNCGCARPSNGEIRSQETDDKASHVWGWFGSLRFFVSKPGKDWWWYGMILSGRGSTNPAHLYAASVNSARVLRYTIHLNLLFLDNDMQELIAIAQVNQTLSKCSCLHCKLLTGHRAHLKCMDHGFENFKSQALGQFNK